jgi:hypothetical protein
MKRYHFCDKTVVFCDKTVVMLFANALKRSTHPPWNIKFQYIFRGVMASL